jgi:hypothetical protein
MPKQVNRYPGISPVTTKSGQRRWKAVVEVGHGADRKQAVRRFTSQEEARAWQAETRTSCWSRPGCFCPSGLANGSR